MLYEVLHQLIDKGETKVDQLAEIAQVSVQTIYNWLSENGTPKETAICRWIILHPSEAVRHSVLREITNGAASFTEEESEPDLDVNRDGKIDMGDALAACIAGLLPAQETLVSVHKSFTNDPNSVTLELQDVVHSSIGIAIRFLQVADRVCGREVSRRHKAKQITGGQ